MKAEWKSFLAAAGAEFNGDDVAVSFGNPDRERKVTLTGNVFADLSRYALVAIHGDDATEFLQGQFSNDVRQVDEHHSLLNAYCSPKGRMLANFRLFKRGDSFYMRIPQEMVESTVKRLRMFVLRSQVTLEDSVETFIAMGISGPDAEAELGKVAGIDLPQAVDEVVQTDQLVIIRVPGILPRFEVYAGFEVAQTLWNALNVQCAPVGASAWNLLEIQAGIPTVYPDTMEAFVPQMANMQLVNGLSFKKGCYPGQEVVARMHYLGKLKRRMYLASVASDQAPAVGEDLYDAAGDGQSCGKIVDAEPHPDGGYSLLAVIQIASAEGGDIRLGSKDGAALELQDLPYSFEVAEA